MATAGIKPGHESSRRDRGRLQPRDRRARRAQARHPGRDHAGPQRHASGASGSDRIVGMMSASGSYDNLPSKRGRGATMGPPACSGQSSPVPFRRRLRSGLQGLSSNWDDWRGQKVFLIRKRSQVRVLDRPSTGSRNCLHLNNTLGFGLLKDRHGRGVPRGHDGATGGYLKAKKRSWFRDAVRWARAPRTPSAAS